MFPIPSAATISTLVKAQKPWPPSPEENRLQEAESSEARVRLPRITGGLPRPNEDLFAFIKRRDERRLRVISSETTLEHQSRLQREENAGRDRPPGRKGARVYYWDLVEGIRVRTAVGRSNYEDIWERYGSHQRRYDSVADEWDICTDLDPHDGPDYDDLDSDDDYDAYFMSANSEMNEEGDHNVGAASSDAFLVRLHRSNDLPPASIQFLEPIVDTAYHRFGFLKQPMQDGRELIISPKIWMKTLGLLGHGRPPLPQGPDDQTKLQLCQFITDLLASSDLQHAPRLCDLAATDIHRRPLIPFEVDAVSSYNGLWFIIQAREARDNEAFSIGLRSAATVMEIARRRWGPRTEDILKCLINEGMPFNTLKASHSPRERKVMPRRRHAILGFRPAGFSPTLQDYHAYEVLRDDFLRSARGRAALLAGGIVARLARDAVNEQDVYDGPTENALQEGEHVLCVWEEGKHFALWDDNLTEEEIDLICGTYEVATGMSHPFTYHDTPNSKCLC
ncbi:hypothetical protein DFJ43DRAFT_1002189 [Lentinula guzmanii]|uniref:Uncharacterized protein n=2 Tax=Lentinula TaxID=5352 RepID=A0AA38J7W1_9AGAR|nr:hypothetical protein DFJ43DRAFT_1002189 [Lentinula guzmanii]KAJ3779764.1 hypothetical protein GGU10DRAFT_280316 [Lentinula aff. detonsa]